MNRTRRQNDSSLAVPGLRPLIAPLLVVLISALVGVILAGLAGWLVGGFAFLTVLVSAAAVLMVNRRAP